LQLIRKVFVLLTGEGAARILGIATMAVLARALGVSQFGIVAFAMNLALVLAVAIDMGQNNHIGRIVAADRERGANNFMHVVVNKAALTAAFAVVAAVVVRLLGVGVEEVAVVVLMIAWAGALSVLETLRAVSRAADMFRSDSAANSLESLLRLVGILAVWRLGGGLVAFALVFPLEAIVSVVVYRVYLGRHVDLRWAAPALDASARFFREALPLGLASLGMAGFYRIDQVLVRFLASTSASGLYAASARVILALNIVSSLVMWAAYPQLVRDRDDHAAFRRQLRHSLLVALASGAVISAAAFVLAGPIVGLLYGSGFAAAAGLVRVLAPIVFLNSATTVGMLGANSLGRERKVVRVVVALTALNIVLNALLVPRFGAYAAAYISTIGEGVMAVSLLSLLRDRMFGRSGEAGGPRREPKEELSA
jgi:O-antigen/teichoic acid export membrane protein